ncbi:MAG: alpha-galactosidase [Cytophagales bacterium]|nr:alpha-galactosidase [Cytophagales bacterium]
MKRRSFLEKSSAAGLALGLAPYLAWARTTHARGQVSQRRILPRWQIHHDGSFSLRMGFIQLAHAYPSLGEEPFYPLRVEVDQSLGRIRYVLAHGTLELQLGADEQGAYLNTRLLGRQQAPAWVYPLDRAQMTGANRFYKQGFGFAGPSGVFDLPQPTAKIEEARLKEEVWSYDSYLFTGLLAPDDETLAWASFDHQGYLHRSTIWSQQTRFGLIDRHLDTQSIQVRTGFATEQIPLNGELSLPTLYFRGGEPSFDTFQGLAQELAQANEVRLDKAPRYHYCSWYEFERSFDQGRLNEVLTGLKSIKPPIAIQTVQIDDGYAEYGDWLRPRQTFASGIEEAIKKIKKAGYEAGLWVAPFMVSSKSFIFNEHPDWLLKDTEGQPVLEWQKEDENVFVLDTSHPEAFAYIREVFRAFRQMGVRYYKTDFLDWGYRSSLKVKRFTPGKTSARYFYEVVQMIRQEIGPDSFWLACIAPFQPLVGLVDAVRVGNDIHPTWTEETTENMITEMAAGQFYNHVLWQNDPDVVYLREHDRKWSPEENQTVTLWNAISEGVLATSDRFHLVPEASLRLWRFIQPGSKPRTVHVHQWSQPNKDWYIVYQFLPDRQAWVLLVLNLYLPLSDRAFSLSDLLGIDRAFVYDWKPGKPVALGQLDRLQPRLYKHQSQLYYITTSPEAPPRNLGLHGVLIEGI